MKTSLYQPLSSNIRCAVFLFIFMCFLEHTYMWIERLLPMLINQTWLHLHRQPKSETLPLNAFNRSNLIPIIGQTISIGAA